MKRLLFGMISCAIVITTCESNKAFATIDETKQMIVVFESDLSNEEMDETVVDIGGEVTEAYEEVNVAKVEVTTESIAELKKDPSVKYVEEDFIIKQSAQMEDYGIRTTHIPEAWNSGFTGRGVRIAVVDSGIAPHNDLVIAGGVSTVDYTSSYIDDQGHGTHVAGIIGARNNSYGVKGVAYESDIYAVKAFNQDGEAFLSDIIEGIDWAIENDIDVINISAGTQTDSTAFQSVIDNAYASGILIVAAAGNDGNVDGLGDTVDFPASYDSVIGVSAVDSNSIRADFSSTGPTVEIAAPGVRILSTYIGNQYAYSSGTSMAAPYVSGVLALIKQAYPYLNNEELRKVLIDQTIDLGVIGRDAFYGYGLMQASSFTQFIQRIEENPVVKLETDKLNIMGTPGDFMQANATAKYKNGESKMVTNEAIWTSENPLVASVSNGKIEFVNYGTTTITVTHEGHTSEIMVNIPNPQVKPIGGNFKDITSFYSPAVDYLVRQQITIGISDTEFGVSRYITRADAAVWLAKELKLNTEAAPPSDFVDVPKRAFGAVNALKQAGIVGGKSKTVFGASDYLSRGEVAIILQRAYQLNSKGTLSSFTDVSTRYKDAVNALVENKVTDGISPTNFGVSSNITRGQLAVFMYRLVPSTQKTLNDFDF